MLKKGGGRETLANALDNIADQLRDSRIIVDQQEADRVETLIRDELSGARGGRPLAELNQSVFQIYSRASDWVKARLVHRALASYERGTFAEATQAESFLRIIERSERASTIRRNLDGADSALGQAKQFHIDLKAHAEQFLPLLPTDGRGLDDSLRELSTPLLIEVDRYNRLVSREPNLLNGNHDQIDDYPGSPRDEFLRRLASLPSDEARESEARREYNRRQERMNFQAEQIEREILSRCAGGEDIFPHDRFASSFGAKNPVDPEGRHDRVRLALAMDGLAHSVRGVEQVSAPRLSSPAEELEVIFRDGTRTRLSRLFPRQKHWTSDPRIGRAMVELLAREGGDSVLKPIGDYLLRQGDYYIKRYMLKPLQPQAEQEIPTEGHSAHSQTQEGLRALANMTYESSTDDVREALSQIPDDLFSHVPMPYVIEAILKLQHYHEIEFYDHVDPELHLAYADKLQALAMSLDRAETEDDGKKLVYFYSEYATRILFGLAEKHRDNEILLDSITDRVVEIAQDQLGPNTTSSVIQSVKHSPTLESRRSQITERVLLENRAAIDE